MARIWFSGPRLGPIRPGISFNLGSRRQSQRQSQRAPMAGQHVYVIEGSHGAVKIGISSDPEARRATLQTGAPHHLFLAFSIYAGEFAYDVEQEAHAILDAHRMPGEWFAVSKEMAIAAVYGAASRLNCSLGEPENPPPQRSLLRSAWRIVWRSSLIFVAVCWLIGLFVKVTGINQP